MKKTARFTKLNLEYGEKKKNYYAELALSVIFILNIPYNSNKKCLINGISYVLDLL